MRKKVITVMYSKTLIEQDVDMIGQIEVNSFSDAKPGIRPDDGFIYSDQSRSNGSDAYVRRVAGQVTGLDILTPAMRKRWIEEGRS